MVVLLGLLTLCDDVTEGSVLMADVTLGLSGDDDVLLLVLCPPLKEPRSDDDVGSIRGRCSRESFSFPAP